MPHWQISHARSPRHTYTTKGETTGIFLKRIFMARWVSRGMESWCLVSVLLLARSTKTTSTAGSDKTNLATSGCVSADGRRLTNMLMVTTTMRMLYRLWHTTMTRRQHSISNTGMKGAESKHESRIRSGNSLSTAQICIGQKYPDTWGSALQKATSTAHTSFSFHAISGQVTGKAVTRDRLRENWL